MEIRNNSVGGSGSDPIDLTKANRDSIRERNPIPPVQATPEADRGHSPEEQKRIAAARDRLEYRIATVRHQYAKVQAVRKNGVPELPEDQVTLSNSSQALAETAIAPRTGELDAATRAQRVSDLRAQYQNGQLDVDSLVAESAYRMLSGE